MTRTSICLFPHSRPMVLQTDPVVFLRFCHLQSCSQLYAHTLLANSFNSAQLETQIHARAIPLHRELPTSMSENPL